MGNDDQITKPRPFWVRTVQGEPLHVSDKILVPVARIVTFGKGQGTVGSPAESGWGVGFARITPLAVLESTAEGQRRIAVQDMTASALRGMLAAAVAVTLLNTVLCRLVRRRAS
jgi:uncharacterized spore protein YtfJ